MQGTSRAPRCAAVVCRPLRRYSTGLIPDPDIVGGVAFVKVGTEGREREKFHASPGGDVEIVPEMRV